MGRGMKRFEEAGYSSGLEKSVFNPGFRVALGLGVAPRAFALLETTGRRSDRLGPTPVGNSRRHHDGVEFVE